MEFHYKGEDVQASYDIGMVGLGVMGRNLVLNMADRGFNVAGYDKDGSRVEELRSDAGDRPVVAVDNLDELREALVSPRVVMVLVPAGAPVDGVIGELLTRMSPGDLVIDGGNSHFRDTDRRGTALSVEGILFMGLGISGGESGARHGPSIMPGGGEEAYARVRPILEAVAARVGDEPCVTYLGQGSAGHYVKMVHNGIEYGLMQLIAEVYDLLGRGAGMDIVEVQGVFDAWNQGESASYLLEITADILTRVDELTGQPLVEVIRDEARQKGTGMWASQDAMELRVPVPTIDAAVAMRNLSIYREERQAAGKALGTGRPASTGDRDAFLVRLKEAFDAAVALTFAQGMALLRTASAAYGYGLDLEAVARIWRGGCIIRSSFLENIREAYTGWPELPNLLLDLDIGQRVRQKAPSLAAVVGSGTSLQIPLPAFMASLSYLDGYRSVRLPANLVQAQRDYFGSHTYERTDAEGVFHTRWTEE